MANQPRDPLEILQTVVDGLTYPSESDESFDVVQWRDPRAASARDAVLRRIDRARRIEQLSLEEFFKQVDDSEDRDRFRRLNETLVNLLRDPAVLRVGAGEIHVDVYLIGRLATGCWAGVHTVSIET
jgi:hypothetical protein